MLNAAEQKIVEFLRDHGKEYSFKLRTPYPKGKRPIRGKLYKYDGRLVCPLTAYVYHQTKGSVILPLESYGSAALPSNEYWILTR